MADVGGIAADRLKAFVRRVLNLDAERVAISEDIKDVYAEAKGTGFDTKTMRTVVARLKAMEKDKEGVLEQEALVALYNEALGVADGGAFDWGNMGRPNLHPGGKAQEPEQPDNDEPEQRDIEDIAPSPQRPAKGKAPKPDPLDTPQPPPVTEDEARAMARQDAEAGKPITSNPFGHRDPNRRVWDEEWCKATGTDGMELPPEWRRKPKPKKDKGGTEGPGQGPDGSGGGDGGDSEKNEGTEP
ncbi:hypothetical protein [Azospirillum argentinense]|uniref:DUF2312 domain-containing protein n=1 Tax=Azospirillum argentinense TaxID=2970906 RepID=UPI0032DE749C